MTETISQDGLARLINLKLTRLNHANRVDAAHFIKGMFGAYDLSGDVIDKSLDSYFKSSASIKAQH